TDSDTDTDTDTDSDTDTDADVAPNAPVVTGATVTNDDTPTWTWTSGGGGNGTFHYKLDDADLASGATETSDLSFTHGTPFGDGETHTLYVQEQNDLGNWSASGSAAITIDKTAPGAPTVTGTTPTNDTTPTWTWTAGGGGNGTFRYKIDDADLTSGATEITVATYTLTAALTHGQSATLYVQERDDVGNWSGNGSFAITVDSQGPSAPTVTASSPTNDTTPTWMWATSDGEGNGTFRYELDDSDLTAGATETIDLAYTHTTPFSNTETHTLYVQERDAVGNWSTSGLKAVLIDTVAPAPPVITSHATGDATDSLTPTIGGTAETGSTVELFRNGVTISKTDLAEAGQWSIVSIALSRGLHTFTATATDAAGNTSGPSTAVIIRVGFDIYIADRGNDRVVHITYMTGGGWSVYGTTGSSTGQFDYPQDISVDSTGRIYVADRARHQIIRFDDMAGTGWTTFGSFGTGTNQLYFPEGVYGGPDGKIYIADGNNSRIVSIDDMSGTNWKAFGASGSGDNQFNFPNHMVIVDGMIHIPDRNNDRLVRIDDMDGTNWTTLGATGSGDNQFNGLSSVTTDKNGGLYIVDAANSRIVQIDDITGANWTTFGANGSGTNQFSNPKGLAIDGDGRIYVADSGNNRIVRVDDMSGTNWTTFGENGSGTDQFSSPVAICIW
ncbi:MAG: hypothetical protein GY854_20785, partial [Deltaproteobacteria bacterium]|nr:hypothetical protein [Deltaproteobacteria bacterium]